MDPLGLSGRVLDDKYAVASAVGEGGYAVVYRATHLVLKRPVAIKVFQAAAKLSEKERSALLNAFVQEASLLADLSERTTAICQARDVGQLETARGEHLPYMVLEWLDGRTLEAILDEEQAARSLPRSLDEAMRLLEPIAQALALAHARGISHRDVKPGNILVLKDGGIKLLDFGVAKVMQDSQPLARTGRQTSFTPAYGAPEQFAPERGQTGPWTDVFAFALVLAEVVAGQPALGGGSLTAVNRAACDPMRRPTPGALGASVSEAVEDVFARALAVAPQERYRTMEDLWAALREASAPARPSPELDRSAAPRAPRYKHPERWEAVGDRAPALAVEGAQRQPKRPSTPAPPAYEPTRLERALHLGAMGVAAVFALLAAREAWGFARFRSQLGLTQGTCTIENVRQDGAGNVFTVALKTGRGLVRDDVREGDVESPVGGFGGGDPDPGTFTRVRGAEVRCFYDAGGPQGIVLRRWTSFAVWPAVLFAAGLAASAFAARWMRRRMAG